MARKNIIKNNLIVYSRIIVLFWKANSGICVEYPWQFIFNLPRCQPDIVGNIYGSGSVPARDSPFKHDI